MKPQKRFTWSCIVALLLAGLATLFLLFAIVFVRNKNTKASLASTSPSVFVSAPIAGETAPAGSYLLANVTAAAQNPIAKVEFWLDGELLETKKPNPSNGGVTTYYAFSNILVSEGLHMFFARAVDTKGLVGQSIPIHVEGRADEIVIAKEGETLADIAAAAGTDTETLQKMNPDMGGGSLAGGSNIKVPHGGGSNQVPDGSKPVILPPSPLPITPPGVTILGISAAQTVDIASILALAPFAPKAPTGMQAGSENCIVRLRWNDNADNETHFNVWMQRLGGPARAIAKLKESPGTGLAWYEFASPQVGIYSFWVEAVNLIGSQPSEMAFMGMVDLSCAPGIATELEIEALDMSIPGNYQRAYCYLSIEGAPEKRVPANNKSDIQVLGGFGDINKWIGGNNLILMHIPADSEVTLEGECWGRQGVLPPILLGTFKVSVPESKWDGKRLELKGDNFTIGYRIQLHGPAQVQGIYSYTDYTLSAPTSLFIDTMTSSNPVDNEKMARRPTLHWAWGGETSRLTGFTILLDGQFFRQIPNWQGGAPGSWDQMFLLPSSCGGVYQFQVTANAGEARSAPSSVYEYKQPLCEIYAEVIFETITFTDVADGSLGSCDTAEVFYLMRVNGEDREFGEFEGKDIEISCGTYYFSKLPALMPQEHSYESVDTFIIPISAQSASPVGISILVNFGDNDPSLFDDADDICFGYVQIFKSSQEWVNLKNSESMQLSCDDNGKYDHDAKGYVTISVRGIIGPPSNP